MSIRPLDQSSAPVSPVRQISEKLSQDSDVRTSWLTNLMVVLLCTVTGVLAFGDVRFSLKSAVDVTLLTVFIYLVTTVVHHAKYDSGVMRGKNTVEYKNAKEKYEQARRKIFDSGISPQMPKLCAEYVAHELDTYRHSLIDQTYVKWDEYCERYRKMSALEIKYDDELTTEAKTLIIAANRAKPIELTANQLMNAENSAKRKTNILGLSPHEKAKRDKYANSITRALTTLLGCAVAVSFAAEPTWANFALWCSRMMPVITGFIVGESSGFATSAVAAPLYLEAKAEKLHALLEWSRTRTDADTDTDENEEEGEEYDDQ
ncbi:MAG: hypothetical protein MJ101_03815 [Clostridia bacterium]|nr:hypothetical protein [Clostridia bacterium]